MAKKDINDIALEVSEQYRIFKGTLPKGKERSGLWTSLCYGFFCAYGTGLGYYDFSSFKGAIKRAQVQIRKGLESSSSRPKKEPLKPITVFPSIDPDVDDSKEGSNWFTQRQVKDLGLPENTY